MTQKPFDTPPGADEPSIEEALLSAWNSFRNSGRPNMLVRAAEDLSLLVFFRNDGSPPQFRAHGPAAKAIARVLLKASDTSDLEYDEYWSFSADDRLPGLDGQAGRWAAVGAVRAMSFTGPGVSLKGSSNGFAFQSPTSASAHEAADLHLRASECASNAPLGRQPRR